MQVIGPYEDLLTTVKIRKLKWHDHVSMSSGLSKNIVQGTVMAAEEGAVSDGKITSKNGRVRLFPNR